MLLRAEGAQADLGLADAQLGSAIAVPRLHETRLVGTLAIGSRTGGSAFTQQDAKLLEVLATTAVSALVADEHARLDGVLLAATWPEARARAAGTRTAGKHTLRP